MEKQFKCKDEVLYRLKSDITQSVWTYAVVSHYFSNSLVFIGGYNIDLRNYDVIPYKDNEHLVGTKDDIEENIELQKGEQIVCNTNLNQLEQGIGIVSYFSHIYNNKIFLTHSVGFYYDYCIRFEDYMDSNNYKDSILTVKDNKIVKLK